MDDIQAMRKRYDRFWDIDPILVRCTVAECIDILERINEYIQLREGWWAPRFRVITQRLTLIELNIELRESKNGVDHVIGTIEVTRYGEGCRLVFRCNALNHENWYRFAYTTIDGFLYAEALLLAEPYEVRTGRYPSLTTQKTLGHTLQPTIIETPLKPSKGATREEWFAYKRKMGRKFTHKELAAELGLNDNYVRQLYTIWKQGQMD